MLLSSLNVHDIGPHVQREISKVAVGSFRSLTDIGETRRKIFSDIIFNPMEVLVFQVKVMFFFISHLIILRYLTYVPNLSSISCPTSTG